jgi:hypothetical protein
MKCYMRFSPDRRYHEFTSTYRDFWRNNDQNTLGRDMEAKIGRSFFNFKKGTPLSVVCGFLEEEMLKRERKNKLRNV